MKVARIILTEFDDGEQATLEVEHAGRPSYQQAERMLQAALDSVREQRLRLMLTLADAVPGPAETPQLAGAMRSIRGLLQ